MSDHNNVDHLLSSWQFDPFSLNVRKCEGSDGRGILQMRIDMGIMQMEVAGRPDGERPGGFPTILDWLKSKSVNTDADQLGLNITDQNITDQNDADQSDADQSYIADQNDTAEMRIGEVIDEDVSNKDVSNDEPDSDGVFTISEDDCMEIDREFVQFYHRRICWLHLHDYANAVIDADHTLDMMDFCREHSKDEQWTVSHEQYRPFVLFHRTQAAALAALETSEGAESSIHEINEGLKRMREIYEQYEVEDQFDEEELVKRLKEMREDLREKYSVGKTLHERLEDAVRTEQYELAAQLRDELAQRNKPDGL